MKRLLLALAIALSSVVTGCGGTTVGVRADSDGGLSTGFAVDLDAEADPWTFLPLDGASDGFHFALVSDRTGGRRAGLFPTAIPRLNLLGPAFVLCTGDLIDGYTEDPAEVDAEWEEFVTIIGKLDAPFFYVPGNHDISNEMMGAKYGERFGATHYDFRYGGALFLCLNTEEEGPNRLGAEQVEWAKGVLAAAQDVRWTFVMMHKPLWVDQPEASGWQEIEDVIAGRPHTVFAGHVHSYTKYERNGQSYIVQATTGAGSGLRGPQYGEFDHVTWVTVTDDGPKIALLTLDGIMDQDVRTEESVRLLAAVQRGDAIAVGPVFTDGGPFSEGRTQLQLANAAGQSMEVTADFVSGPDLSVEPSHVEATVPAGGTQSVNLLLRALPAAAEEPRPVAMNWTVSYELPGRPPLTMDGKAQVGVVALAHCPKRTAPVNVDGDLSDWDALPFECTAPRQILHDPATWQGPADCSFRFGTAWDDEFLYIAVDVADDQLTATAGRNPWEQDGIEVRVDARPEAARSAGRGANEFADTLLVAMSPGEGGEPLVTFGADRLPEGVRSACVSTAAGQAAEIAIPCSWLDQKQGGDWRAFRLNIAVDDFDGPGDRGAQVWWQPDWRGDLNYAGSGTFARR
jgi:hypothetical protein